MQRYEYVLDLPRRNRGLAMPDGAAIRPVTGDDHEAVAQLMLDAYRDTIDYEGETIVEARTEVRGAFAAGVLDDACFMLTVEDRAAAAIVAMPWDANALVGFVMTRPEFTGRGFASFLVDRCVAALEDQGIEAVHAFITDGNTPSETVFVRAGFQRQPDPIERE